MVADVLELRVVILTGLNEGTRGLGASTTLWGAAYIEPGKLGTVHLQKCPP